MIAAALMGLAAVLLIGPAPQVSVRRLHPLPARPQWTLPGWVAPAGAVLLVLAVGIGFKVLAWLATGAVMTATIAYLGLGWRRRVQAMRAAEVVAKVARVLSGLLRSGQLPVAALAEAAVDFEVLRPAATAAALGGDVAAELERAASSPGQGGMRAIAAAWRLSQRSGSPVAEVLALVAESLRQQRRVQAIVDAELAAARTSGHIMAFLPLLACGLGLLVGVNTFGFLIGDPVGQVLLFGAVTLTAGGVLWIDRLSRFEEV